MKIQNINKYINYNTNSNIVKKETPKKTEKYDAIEIKNIHNKNKDIKLNNIKKNIVSDINRETDTNKIEKIKESIKNNTYNIDSNEIAKKMLK